MPKSELTFLTLFLHIYLSFVYAFPFLTCYRLPLNFSLKKQFSRFDKCPCSFCWLFHLFLNVVVLKRQSRNPILNFPFHGSKLFLFNFNLAHFFALLCQNLFFLGLYVFLDTMLEHFFLLNRLKQIYFLSFYLSLIFSIFY